MTGAGGDRSALLGWTYRRAEAEAAVEIGTVRGRDVALPAHFHDEDQVTIVLAGHRRFLLRGEVVVVEAGGCVLIPARVVHRSLVEPRGVSCVNLYMPAGDYAAAAMGDEIRRLWRSASLLTPSELIAIVQRHRTGWRDLTGGDDSSACGVVDITKRTQLSREARSRAFAREHGMPPHAFGRIIKLNHARGLLRRGVPLVEAALDAGFADQSHLGRCFRHAFGVTPGQFREGQRSQTFQTRA